MWGVLEFIACAVLSFLSTRIYIEVKFTFISAIYYATFRLAAWVERRGPKMVP
jgi:hypothetical protein